MYRTRLLEKTINDSARAFPAIVITGPRQSGKSTLIRHLFNGKKASFINLDNPEYRALLQDDPGGYLESVQKPVVIDEIQYMPELLSYVKILIDKDRTPGSFFITGSQQFQVMKNVSESLAGRAAILSLPTFQMQENKPVNRIEDFLLRSTYPEPALNTKINTNIWYSSYLQTYLERDVRSILNVHNLRDFEQFIRLLAARAAQELNYSSLSRQLGISIQSIKRWISVLEASYIIFLLPPFFKNYGKRIIKAPKLYFYDTALINHLIGITEPNMLLNGPMAGALFENAVVSEIIKLKYATGIKPELYYWRSQSGIEVDLILPHQGKFVPCEIKLTSSIKPGHCKNVQYWLKQSGQQDVKANLISNCNKTVPLPQEIRNVHWQALSEGLI